MDITKIHEDERGEMYIIPLDDEKDLLIYTTNAGYARGGGVHTESDEYFVVIQGDVEVYHGDSWHSYHAGQLGFIPRGTPHMMIAATDCLMMEWGAPRSDKNTFDETLRQKVENINKARNIDKEVTDES